MDLKELGWNKELQEKFLEYKEKGYEPARVACEYKNIYAVICETGEFRAELSGRFWYDLQNELKSKGDLPTVGDWVALSYQAGATRAFIHGVLPRKSKFSRKIKIAGGKKIKKFEGAPIIAGGTTGEQILAANIDTVFYVVGLDFNLSLSRIERFLTLVWECGATPVIVCNKVDLCEDYEVKIEEVENIAMGVPVYAVSGLLGEGMEQLDPYIKTGQTSAFIGSSGVGKSTIINSIVGEDIQVVQQIRAHDGKGRHTTTSREMVIMPGKGILIDTPGLRELQLWTGQGNVIRTFRDIEDLKTQCQFRNCSHGSEPGCAITSALEDGSLDPEHYKSYLKQQREIRYLKRKQNERDRMIEKIKFKRKIG